MPTPITPAEQTVEPSERSLPVFDPLLLLAGIGLILCSYEMLKVAAGASEAERQLMYGGGGALVAIAISRFDYSRLRRLKYVLYGLLIVLDVAVLGSPQVNGAHRWIPLPGFSFQSSEFGKVLLIVALAGFAVDRPRQLSERRMTARIMLLAVLAAVLVIPEPDLGTGLVYVAIGFAILFFAQVSWKQIAGIVALFAIAAAVALTVAPAFGVHVVKPYQTQRLTAFLNPGHPSPKTPGAPDPWYQIRQSEIAVGSGQRTGQGARATQSALGFLPEPDTDFAFASLAEIYGFVGGAVVLALYALLLWRGLRIVAIAKNLFGALIAGGIVAMLTFQVFVNIGMTVGIAPITGVPLPLVSYGGSSVIVTFIAIGLLESIYVQGRNAAAAKNRALVS